MPQASRARARTVRIPRIWTAYHDGWGGQDVRVGDIRNGVQTPLTVIQGYLNLIKDDEVIREDSRFDEWLKVIDENIERIKCFVMELK